MNVSERRMGEDMMVLLLDQMDHYLFSAVANGEYTKEQTKTISRFYDELNDFSKKLKDMRGVEDNSPKMSAYVAYLTIMLHIIDMMGPVFQEIDEDYMVPYDMVQLVSQLQYNVRQFHRDIREYRVRNESQFYLKAYKMYAEGTSLLEARADHDDLEGMKEVLDAMGKYIERRQKERKQHAEE